MFTPRHFLDLAGRPAVTSALMRQTSAGTIRQLGRGLYDYPKLHQALGPLTPTPEALATALAGRDRVRLQPSGAYAANLLGLSEQVPAKVVFLTDGPGLYGHGRAADRAVATDDTAQHGRSGPPVRTRDPGAPLPRSPARDHRAGGPASTHPDR